MNHDIVVLDTETDGLHDQRMPWEIAVYRSLPGVLGGKRWDLWHVYIDTVDTVYADPVALRIGRWHERFPHQDRVYTMSDPATPSNGSVVDAELGAHLIHRITDGKWIVGANPAFDMGAMGNLMARFGLSPRWKYRPVCVSNYAAAQQSPPILPRGLVGTAEMLRIDMQDDDMHTAVGDARLTLAVASKVGLTNEGAVGS